MKPQIVHEAEIHRQHVRLRIPISVEIDGTRYRRRRLVDGRLRRGGADQLAPTRRALPGAR